MKKMRAVMFYAPKQIRLVEVPLPSPGPGEIVVKVGAALTCGTDFKAYRQGHRVLLGDLPAPFGHELAGTVVETGSGVIHLKNGDRVVCANSAPCDECFYCRRGQNQLCDRLKLHNGAYAEYNLVPAHIVRHNVWKLPDALGFAEAALSEPLACAIHGAEVLSTALGETTAIIGSGPMALLLIQALRAKNTRVLVFGRDRQRLELARQAGAHEVHSAHDVDPVEAVRAATEGRGADCVFEAVGQSATWQQSLAMVRKGGRVCLFGGCAQGTMVPVDAHRVHYGQISLHGVFHHTPLYFRQAVELLGRGAVRTQLLIHGRIPLGDVPAFFDANHERSGAKVAVIP